MEPGRGVAHRLRGGCPHVVELRFRFGAGELRGCGAVWLAGPAGIGFGDVEAEGFEFGDELAESFVVVEPGAVVGELLVGQDAR